MSSSKLRPIIFYDIPCTTPGRPWSPNTMKTRYCLGYKGLPFTTIWVEFPDVAGLLQSKHITHPPYTLPAIEDPNTGAFVVDSLAIATYLDETYPEMPKVLSSAARTLLKQAGDAFSFGSGGGAGADVTASTDANASPGSGVPGARDPALLVFLILGGERLNPVSKAYYYQTRAARLGERWTTLVSACSASPEERAECVRRGIKAIEGELVRKLTALYDCRSGSEEGKSGGPFALGVEPCFFDFAVAGRMKFLLDDLSPEPEVTILDGVRLAQLVEDLERYYKY